MRRSRLSFVKDPSVADWIAPRLGPLEGLVGSVVPRGFPAYARVLHPVRDHDGKPATWSTVCAKTGRVAHALMQWQSVGSPVVEDGTGRSTSGGMPWDGEEPLVGELEPQALAALCRLLAEHTDPALDCFFALWEGWGWIPGGESMAVLRASGAEPPTAAVPPAFREDVMSGRRLHHPGRNYLLFSGPLEAAMALGHWPSQDRTASARSHQASSGPRTAPGASPPRSTSTRPSSLAITTSSTRYSAPQTWRQRPSSPATALTSAETRSMFNR